MIPYKAITNRIIMIRCNDTVKYLIKTIYLPSECQLSICDDCKVHKIIRKCNFLCEITDDPNDPFKRNYHFSIIMDKINLYLSKYIQVRLWI